MEQQQDDDYHHVDMLYQHRPLISNGHHNNNYTVLAFEHVTSVLCIIGDLMKHTCTRVQSSSISLTRTHTPVSPVLTMILANQFLGS